MNEQQQTELNGRIADALFGWDRKESGLWADPTGDEFKLPPNYCDNSGLVVGLEYKLRRRGFSIKAVWNLGEGWEYTLSKDGKNYVGIAELKSLALAFSIKAVLDANALVK